MKAHRVLRAERQAHRLTQAQLASRAGVSLSTIERWEKHGLPPQARALVRVCRALSVTDLSQLDERAAR